MSAALSVQFDPSLLSHPRLPAGASEAMVGGVRQHLRRYGEQHAAQSALARLEDPEWLRGWDVALRSAAGRGVVFHGSELGVLALRARSLGASRVLAIEPYALTGKVAAGIVQKNLLIEWHAAQRAAGTELASNEQKQASFEAFARDIDVLPPDAAKLQGAGYDVFAFPALDHTLLGTGIVPALEAARAAGLAPDAQLLPAGARVFAMGVQWDYSATSFRLEPMNQFRWSPYPQVLDAPPGSWKALTQPLEVGTIDFARFAPGVWDVRIPVVCDGTLDAIVYWFELQLGDFCISNAPGSPCTALQPAIQYTDSRPLQTGSELAVSVQVTQTRLYFGALPGPQESRSALLPAWYLPMMHDGSRNDAYRVALDNAARAGGLGTVLDIGAGAGLLSMMAARSGASAVYGCEVSRGLTEAAQRVLALNGCEAVVKLINKDCRKLAVPDDLPQRADVAVFEMFDCSLIGEGILHFLTHARAHLLRDNARYLPMSGRIRAVVVEYRLERLAEVDVNLLNPYRFAPGFINVDADKLRYRALSDPFDVFSFDFATATAESAEAPRLLDATSAGVVGAVLFWFELQLDEQVSLSNEPGRPGACHWKQGLQFLPEARVSRGDKIPLVARHDGSSLTFQWQEGKMQREAFSRLPRFDARAWGQAAALDQQTRGLLQQCQSDPQEHSTLAQLAMAFAVDPAAHGLHPEVAQRFASLFLSS